MDANDLMAGWEKQKCELCGGDFYTMKGSTDKKTYCRECEHRTKKAEKLNGEFKLVTENRTKWAAKWMEKAGVSPRELQASAAKIPTYISSHFYNPALRIAELRAGKIPANGFGLSGSAGSGKSFALVALFKECLYENWYLRCQTEGLKGTNLWLAWVRWPEKVNQIRVESLRDKGAESVMQEMERLAEIEALVLDDMGAERIKGDYNDDWATSQLDLLIDRRYNAMKPTWFTTNLSAQDFANRYGARMFSRLCGENPLVKIGGHPDMRAVSRKEK